MTCCGAKLACGKFDWLSTIICWSCCPCFTIPCVFYKLSKHGWANRLTRNMIENLNMGDTVCTHDEDHGKRIWIVVYREKMHTVLFDEDKSCMLDLTDFQAHSRFVVDWCAKYHGHIENDEFTDMKNYIIASNHKIDVVEVRSEWCNAPCVARIYFTIKKDARENGDMVKYIVENWPVETRALHL